MPFIGNQPADKFLTLEKQVFTTSATDTYTLDREVSSVNDIELFLNNVRQEPTEAYTISGTTLTLASAITASDSMYCIYQGRAVGTQSPATGSVTNDMLAGSIANSKLANSSVTVNGTSIDLGASGTISAGITEADTWRVSTGFSMSTGTTTISSNWERDDSDGYGLLGTGMSESSGIFTFPNTGIWRVYFNLSVNHTAIYHYVTASIHYTSNNSSYDVASEANTSLYANGNRHYNSVNCDKIFDITDTTNQKVRFMHDSQLNGVNLAGGSSLNVTYATFIRLGDT